MTTDRMALRDLLEKGSDVDLLREMIGYVAQRLMSLEVESLCGAGHGERTPVRTTTCATGIGIGSGRPAPARSSCRSPSSGRAPPFPASWSRGARPRRRWRR